MYGNQTGSRRSTQLKITGQGFKKDTEGKGDTHQVQGNKHGGQNNHPAIENVYSATGEQ